MGSDSFAGSADEYRITSSPKVLDLGSLMVGFVGSWRSGQKIFAWLASAVIVSPRSLIQDLLSDLEVEDQEWNLLIMAKEWMAEIQGDWSLMEIPLIDGVAYHAIGGGSGPALGSLFADHSGEESVHQSLLASEAFYPLVRPPMRVTRLQ
jgi:hypothetical protein